MTLIFIFRKRLLSTGIALSLFLLTAYNVHPQGQLRGRVIDRATDEPIPFVSIALYAPSDSVVALAGSITDTLGYYVVAALKPGTYQLKTFYIGYRPLVQSVTVERGIDTNLSPLRLEAESKLLEEVRVTGQRANILVKGDRQTYRAAQFQSAAGGTATDILRNLPGITVNAEGDVSLRGTNGFLVLLNGKPVQANLGTLLNQLPANSIESIEVITTPNARFDPDGKAGIIAIITKKGTENGWSALANGMLGLPSTQSFDNILPPRRYSGDVTLNYRSNHWDVVMSSAYIRNDIAGRRVGDVRTTLGDRITQFPSEGERSFDRYTFTNRLGVAYVPDAFNSWNAGLYYSKRTEDRLADIVYNNTTTSRSTGQIINRISYFNSNLVRKKGEFYTANLDYLHTFTNKATISAGALYEYDYISGFTANRNLNRTNFRDTLQYTYTTTNRPIQNLRANLDASWPVWGGKMEVGYQYRDQQDNGDYLYREKQGNNTPLRVFPEFTGLISINNRIHSTYAQYSTTHDKIEFTAGLRYEHAIRLLKARQNDEFNLRLNNLFPSVNLLYRAKEDLTMRAGFSRRVQRSSNLALNPLPEREHSETLEQGDPNLLPEFVNLGEMSLSKQIANNTILATVYYQGIENIINRVNKVYADTILSRIYTNAGKAQRGGLELAADLKLTQRWKLYVSGNLYRYNIAGQLFQNEVIYDRTAWTSSINMSTTVQATPSLSVQGSVNYLSRRITAQGEDSRFLIPSLSVKKSMLNNRLIIQAQWQNIGLGFLPTNEQRITTRGQDFFTTTNYIQEKDIFLLNVSYSFRQLSKRTKLPGNEVGDKEF
jgi:outer membrane receptor protein involved in Fe transport